jgi:hypothetical protein
LQTLTRLLHKHLVHETHPVADWWVQEWKTSLRICWDGSLLFKSIIQWHIRNWQHHSTLPRLWSGQTPWLIEATWMSCRILRRCCDAEITNEVGCFLSMVRESIGSEASLNSKVTADKGRLLNESEEEDLSDVNEEGPGINRREGGPGLEWRGGASASDVRDSEASSAVGGRPCEYASPKDDPEPTSSLRPPNLPKECCTFSSSMSTDIKLAVFESRKKPTDMWSIDPDAVAFFFFLRLVVEDELDPDPHSVSRICFRLSSCSRHFALCKCRSMKQVFPETWHCGCEQDRRERWEFCRAICSSDFQSSSVRRWVEDMRGGKGPLPGPLVPWASVLTSSSASSCSKGKVRGFSASSRMRSCKNATASLTASIQELLLQLCLVWYVACFSCMSLFKASWTQEQRCCLIYTYNRKQGQKVLNVEMMRSIQLSPITPFAK